MTEIPEHLMRRAAAARRAAAGLPEIMDRFAYFLRIAGPPAVDGDPRPLSPAARWRFRFAVWWLSQPVEMQTVGEP